MTFTFDESLSTDLAKVRHHIGDIDSTRAWFTDAHINGVISLEGSWKKAVIACIQSMIARSALEPDMSADWLTLHPDTSTKALERLLTIKARELDVSLFTATAVHTYRPDSDQTEEVDYDE